MDIHISSCGSLKLQFFFLLFYAKQHRWNSIKVWNGHLNEKCNGQQTFECLRECARSIVNFILQKENQNKKNKHKTLDKSAVEIARYIILGLQDDIECLAIYKEQVEEKRKNHSSLMIHVESSTFSLQIYGARYYVQSFP